MAIPTVRAEIAGTTGSLAAPAAVSASEEIVAANVDNILAVTNGGGSPINVTFVDPGKTPAGNTGTEDPAPVAAGTTRRWKLTSAFVNPATKKIVVNFSGTTDVTAEIIGT